MLQRCCYVDALTKGQHWHWLAWSSLGYKACRFGSRSSAPPFDGDCMCPLHASARQMLKTFLQVRNVINAAACELLISIIIVELKMWNLWITRLS